MVTQTLAEGSAENGFRVLVLCFSRKKTAIELVGDFLTIKRCRMLFSIFSQPFSLVYLLIGAWAASRNTILHVHSPNMLALLLILFSRGKVVLHWHSDVISKGLIGIACRPLELLALSRSHRIIVTSAPYLNHSEALRGYRHKVRVIPIGIRDFAVKDRVGGLSPRVSSWNEMSDRIVLSVGRLVKYKGYDDLICAAEFLCEEAILIIVGDGPERQRLWELVETKDLQHKVRLVGKLSDAELEDYFRAATAFCMTSVSRAEAYGVVLIAAMSHGIPLVTTAIPGSGVGFVNENGVTGYTVPVGNVKEIAEKCNLILTSQRLRAEFSRRARVRYEREFTVGLFRDRVSQLYSEL